MRGADGHITIEIPRLFRIDQRVLVVDVGIRGDRPRLPAAQFGPAALGGFQAVRPSGKCSETRLSARRYLIRYRFVGL
jgi:hypothetical protein